MVRQECDERLNGVQVSAASRSLIGHKQRSKLGVFFGDRASDRNKRLCK
jgi:hypothetical protein